MIDKAKMGYVLFKHTSQSALAEVVKIYYVHKVAMDASDGGQNLFQIPLDELYDFQPKSIHHWSELWEEYLQEYRSLQEKQMIKQLMLDEARDEFDRMMDFVLEASFVDDYVERHADFSD